MQIFKPAWWCQDAHAQTILGALLRSAPRLGLRRERINTPDGDFLDIDFLESPASNDGEKPPLVVILHGLEGSSKASYVQTLLGEIRARGGSAVAVNMRMCSGEPNRVRQTYHSGKTEDLDCVVHFLKEIKGYHKLYLVGFSIGGNIALKWLGEQGREASKKIQSAVAVSVPYDLVRSVRLLDRGFNRAVYTRNLLRSLKTKVFIKRKLFPDACLYEKVKRCRTFREFDSLVTAPLNGFQDARDYWSKSSCKSFLRSICIPTLLVHAEDDPFFPGRFLPTKEINNSQHLRALVVPKGGHLGFVMGPWPWKREHWLENTLLDFFSNCPAGGTIAKSPVVAPPRI